MQTVERHGGGSHFVRPDRVYRTGVLTSTMGYDPGQDVQSVASSFTAYPMDLSTTPGGLEGLGRFLGATSSLGLIDKLRLKFANWKARQGMNGMRGMHGMRGLRGLGYAAQTAQFMPGGAYGQVGEVFSPAVVAKEEMIAYLMNGGAGMPEGYAESQASTSRRNWTTNWWNSRYG